MITSSTNVISQRVFWSVWDCFGVRGTVLEGVGLCWSVCEFVGMCGMDMLLHVGSYLP